MATTRFPDTTDKPITEANWTGANIAASGIRSWRQTGWDLSINSGLDLDIAAGTAYVGGYYVNVSTTTTLTLTDNLNFGNANRIWLQADGTIYANASNTPTDATDLFLGWVETNSGSITAISPSYELDVGSGVEIENKRVSFGGVLGIGFNQNDLLRLDLAVEPGLYWVSMRLSGNNTSTLQNYGIRVTCLSAAEASANLSVHRHTEYIAGGTGEGTFLSSGELWIVSNSGGSGELTSFFVVHGMMEFADTGSIEVKLSTGGGSAINTGYLVAKKIR